MAAERNTEIWSTRLQRELLALTTDNAPEDAKEEVTGILPPFVTVKDHALAIEKGDCVVSFVLDLPVKPKGGKTEETADGEKSAEGEKAEPEEPVPIIVTLDVSLQKKHDGSVDPIAVAYPFLKPLAMLKSGSARFPDGSTIRDGDLIDLDMDWTPSLHLTDSILNIALKIKESILQGEPFHAAVAENGKQDPVEDMVNRAKKLGSSFTKGLQGLAKKTPEKEGGKQRKGLGLGRKKKKEPAEKANPGEIRIGDEINMLEPPWVDCNGVYSCKAIRRPAFVDDAISVASQVLGKEKVRSSSALGEDDGEVPADFSNFMLSQASSVAQVCGRTGKSNLFAFVSCFVSILLR